MRKATQVSKKGFSQAKADLSMASLVAIRHDSSIKQYWECKKAEKKSGVVFNAIKFKLVQRMFAVIKRGTPFVDINRFKE